MDLRYFTDLRQASPLRVINWLKNCALLANPLHCGECKQAMSMVERSDVHVDGYKWLVEIQAMLTLEFYNLNHHVHYQSSKARTLERRLCFYVFLVRS